MAPTTRKREREEEAESDTTPGDSQEEGREGLESLISQYATGESRVVFSTSDNELLAVDRKRLKRSGVFHAMLDSAHQADSQANAIDIDVPAETLALFFDIFGTSSKISIKGLTTSLSETHSLMELADKFDIEWIALYADQRLDSFKPWDVLAYASQHERLELGKRAIRRLPLRRELNSTGLTKDPSWNVIERLGPSWQLALIKLLMPAIYLGPSDNGVTSPVCCLTIAKQPLDLDKIATEFNPTA